MGLPSLNMNSPLRNLVKKKVILNEEKSCSANGPAFVEYDFSFVESDVFFAEVEVIKKTPDKSGFRV